MNTLHRRAVAIAIAISLTPTLASAAPVPRSGDALSPHAPDALLVAFEPGTPRTARARVRADLRVLAATAVSPTRTDVERWRLPAGTDLPAAMARLATHPAVRYSEPDWVVTRADVANDQFYVDGSLWGMHGDEVTTGANPYGSGADEAWALGYTGSRTVYVGVLDEGIQWQHPDLSANIWVNPGEIPGNGRDDDNNGYVDDVRGWDFWNEDASVFDGSSSTGWDDHGTHVAGTIGAEGGNGSGVAGVSWRVTIIPAKFMGVQGGYVTDAIRATDYLVDLRTRHGIDLVAINNSWTSTGFSQTLLEAIDRGGDLGILSVAAAGNAGISNDPLPAYPSSYQCTKGGTRAWDCVVSVAALESDGRLASYSSYGVRSVDLAAPGSRIISTYPFPAGSYASMSGTSMAAPHVTGAAALCASINPVMRGQALKEAIVGSGTPTAGLEWLTSSGVRLDVGALARVCAPAPAVPTGSVTDLTAGIATVEMLQLRWTDGVVGETLFEIQRAVSTNGVCGTFRTVATVLAGTTTTNLHDVSAATSYCIRVRGTNNAAGGSATAWSATVLGRTQDPPPPYRCLRAPLAWIDPSGGTTLPLTDDSTGVIQLPAGFLFMSYGMIWSDVTVSSNGFIRMGIREGPWATNAAIPNALEPNGIIAPAWDDWAPGPGSRVSVKTVGVSPDRRVAITWSNVGHMPPTSSTVSFQAILEEGGDVVRFQYLDMLTGDFSYDYGASATVGIESWDGLWGTQVSNNARSLSDGTAYRCSMAPSGPAPTVTTSSLTTGTTTVGYGPAALTATGGKAPYTWSLATGSLPPGLSLTTGGGITGTPSATGSYAFTVRVTGDDASSSTRALSLAVYAPVAITTASLATATAGAAYGPVALAASGGQPGYAWSVASGNLPSGVTLSTGGVLTGTPTASGTFAVSVRATDVAGRTATRALTLTVNFGKVAPANGAKLPTGTTSASLTWATHLVSGTPASKYRYCVASSASACPNAWTEVTATSGAKAVSGGQTWYWQVQAWSGSAWIAANAGTVWKFSVAR